MQVLGSLSLQAHLLSPIFPLCPANSGLRDGRTLTRHFTTPNRVDRWHALQTLALQSHTACLTPSSRDHPAVSGTLSFTAKLLQFLFIFFSVFIYESGVPKQCSPHCHPFSLCFVSRRVFLSDTPSKDTKHEVATSGPGCRALSRREVPRQKISFFTPLPETLLQDAQGFLPQPPGWPAAPRRDFALSNTIPVCKCLKAVSFV